MSTATEAWFFAAGAHQRRAADVDLLDQVVEGDVRTGGRRLERVEVGDDDLERCDPRVAQLRAVVVAAQVREQAAVDRRMERLHAAVEHLG